MDVITQEKKKLLINIEQLKKDIPKLQKKYPEIKAKLLVRSINFLGGWIEDIPKKRGNHGINPEVVRVIQMLNNISSSINKLIHTQKLCKYFREPNFCCHSGMNMECNVFNEQLCSLYQKAEEKDRSKGLGKKMIDVTAGLFKKNKMVEIDGFKKKEVKDAN